MPWAHRRIDHPSCPAAAAHHAPNQRSVHSGKSGMQRMNKEHSLYEQPGRANSRLQEQLARPNAAAITSLIACCVHNSTVHTCSTLSSAQLRSSAASMSQSVPLVSRLVVIMTSYNNGTSAPRSTSSLRGRRVGMAHAC